MVKHYRRRGRGRGRRSTRRTLDDRDYVPETNTPTGNVPPPAGNPTNVDIGIVTQLVQNLSTTFQQQMQQNQQQILQMQQQLQALQQLVTGNQQQAQPPQAQPQQAQQQPVQQLPVQPPQQQQPHHAHTTRITLPDFIKSNRYFDGSSNDPAIVEDWLSQVERSFVVYEIQENQKVAYGTYLLKMDARIWWDSKQGTITPPVT